MVISKPGRGRPSRRYILEQVDLAMTDLAQAGGLPDADVSDRIWRDLWHLEAHHSTAIEGNTLVLRQVRTLLEEGRPVGDKELCEYLDVQGYADAARWVYSQARTTGAWGSDGVISRTELRQIHQRAVGLVWEVCPPSEPPLDPHEGAGSFRRHDIRPFPDGMRPPSWTEVDAHITDWLADLQAGPHPDEHVLEMVARTHVALESIDPFRDGNGRTGRLVMNLLLVRHGYPPAVIRTGARDRYLAAIRRGDAGDHGPLTEFVARAVKESIDRFLLPDLASPEQLVPLAALDRPGLRVRSLRAAAEKGRLTARRDASGRWLSTQQWVEEYLASRPIGRPATRKPEVSRGT